MSSDIHSVLVGETWRKAGMVAKASGSAITAGTVNYYLKALTGANAGKWWKNADQTWDASETANAMTHQADGSWTIELAATPFADAILYLEYSKESGDLHVAGEGRLVRGKAVVDAVNATQWGGTAVASAYVQCNVERWNGNDVGNLPANFTAFAIDASGRIDLGKWLGGAPYAMIGQSIQAVVPSTQNVNVYTIKGRDVTDVGAGNTVYLGTAAWSTLAAGAAMSLTSDERIAIAAAMEAAIINELDGTAVIQAIADLIASDMTTTDLTVAAIAAACRDAILNRVLSGNHGEVGTPGLILQYLETAIGTVAGDVSDVKVKTDNLPASPAATGDIPSEAVIASRVDAVLSSTHGAGSWLAGTVELSPEQIAAIAGDVSDAVGEDLDAIKAKTDTIGTVAVTIVSPVAATGAISLIRGDDYAASLGNALEFSGTTWPDLSGASLMLTVRNASDGVELAVAGSIVAAGGATQSVRFEPTAAQTGAMTVTAAHRHAYDVQATLAGGAIRTLVRGYCAVVQDQTR